MDPSTGDLFGGRGAEVLTVEIDASEAATGSMKTIVVPPGPQAITVPIPPGVDDQTVLLWPGMATPDPASGQPRDLVVRIAVRPAAGGPLSAPLPGPPWTYPTPVAPAGRRRRRAWPGLIAAGVLVLVLGVFVAPSLFRIMSNGPRLGADPSPTAAVPPSPSATPVTGTEYQQVLTTLDAALAPVLQQLAPAHTPVAVRDAAAAAQLAVVSEVDKLRGLAPPAPAQPAHRDLVAGLDDLGSRLGQTASSAASRRLCAGSSAISYLSQSVAAGRIRAAAKSLATADPARAYQVGAFLPPVTADANRRLANGTVVKRASGGAGTLKVDNGGRTDSAVSLVPTNATTPALVVYVRAGGKVTVGRIRDGTYQIFLTTGADWDTGLRRFTRDCTFERFDVTSEFTTTRTRYTEWDLTLGSPGGAGDAASTSEVDPSAFPSG